MVCYLGTSPEEHHNVVKYVFVINELFLGNKGTQWRDYDAKFRKHQDSNPTLQFGFKDVEVWLEVVSQGRKSVEGQVKKPFLGPKSGGGLSR